MEHTIYGAKAVLRANFAIAVKQKMPIGCAATITFYGTEEIFLLLAVPTPPQHIEVYKIKFGCNPFCHVCLYFQGLIF